jgi:hypothetical protein
MIDRRERCVRKGESVEISTIELMALWIYDEKFSMCMQFLFRTLLFTVGEDDFEYPA